MRIYLIPGLGADHRLFHALKIEGVEMHYLDWFNPEPDDTLATYAARMAKKIDSSAPFILLGMCMGGMVSVEMAKHVSPEKIIIVSSAKERRELPLILRLAGKLGLYRLITPRFMKRFTFLVKPLVGGISREDYALFKKMLTDTDDVFLAWARKAIVCWDNKIIPQKLTHIHGTLDLVLPVIYVRNYIPIRGGGHYMIIQRAKEISAIVNKLLRAEA